MSEHFLFVEKYRPKTVAECILPESVKSIFQGYVDTKSVPHLLLSGTPGTGKTTVARAICEEIGLSYMYINASKERGIDTLRTKIESYAVTVSLLGNSKVIILDEADYLTPEAQAGLRGVMEMYSSNCTFILTCNLKSRLTDAIHSRCTQIDFKIAGKDQSSMAAQLLKRIEFILRSEGVEYERAVVAQIISKNFPDYRSTLNEIQKFASLGKIDAGIIPLLNDIRKIKVLIEALKAKDFGKMRKWVVDNGDVDHTKIYRKIYDSSYEFFRPASIPAAVLLIAKYQYQAAFVADQEVNLVACLTEIMLECEFV